MDAGQFDRYTQGLAQISVESRQAVQVAAQRLETTKLLNKLIKQTAFCVGSSASATRAWLDDIMLALNRVGPNHIIEVATSNDVRRPTIYDREMRITQNKGHPVGLWR